MRHEAATLDYFTLLREGKQLGLPQDARTLRIGILGDCATQQLGSFIKTLAARGGVRVELYEGGYDAIDLDILNPASDLYAFDPAYVIVLMTEEKLKSRLYEATDRSAFVDQTIARIRGLWQAFGERSGAMLIQSTFVLPSERGFGNYELTAADSVGAIIAEINHQLAVQSREARNVLLADVDFLAAGIGRRQWRDPRMWNMAKVPCRLDHLPALAQSLLDVVLAASGQFAKCVVLDLDNTLWGGVIGDDGLDGIQLGEFDEGEAFVGLQKFIRELKRRGIILAVVSKNEHANAILPFAEHPYMVLRENDISVFVANWENKADNIRLIQKTLNIGFDSLVFLDDNPFERDLVRTYLPDVVVPDLPEDPSLYLDAIARLNLFETASYSQADPGRADQYREAAQRELTKGSYSSIGDYLASLDMKIRAERFNSFNLPRIAQLIARSNQFNLMTRRYGEAACEALMNAPDVVPFTLKLGDKFGDYGLISVIVLKHAGTDLAIDEYLMSCRVLQRGVENFAMNAIFGHAAQIGATRVTGRYIPTAKNAMVRDFFGTFGFEIVADEGILGVLWALEVDRYVPRDAIMTADLNAI